MCYQRELECTTSHFSPGLETLDIKLTDCPKAPIHATITAYNHRNWKSICVCKGSSSCRKWLTSISIWSEVYWNRSPWSLRAWGPFERGVLKVGSPIREQVWKRLQFKGAPLLSDRFPLLRNRLKSLLNTNLIYKPQSNLKSLKKLKY